MNHYSCKKWWILRLLDNAVCLVYNHSRRRNTIFILLCPNFVLLNCCWQHLSCNQLWFFSHAHACVTLAVHQCNVINVNFDGSINAIHHMALAADKSNNEVYTFCEILKQDDAADFVKAMNKEIQDHEFREHWEVIKRS